MAVSAAAVYANSLQGPFIFDDEMWILNNPQVRHLWPLTEALKPPPQLPVFARPLLSLSLAVNYALGGLDAAGYHLFNAAVHVLAALLLFGVVRRTLLSPPLKERWAASSSRLAAAAAVLWAVHPLQTESVTYVIQRSESMAGLLLFASLYASIRFFEGKKNAQRWSWAAAVFGVLAVCAKPGAAVVPLIVLLHDAVFFSGSAAKALKNRLPFYGRLAAAWAALAAICLYAPKGLDPTAGFGLKEITPLQYGLTQPGVILHYLRLVALPWPLCLDYEWPPVSSLAAAAAPLAVVAVLAAAILWLFLRNRPAGYLGLWVILTLAPSSSVIPVADLAFEHRMYLPLAGLAAAAVFVLWAWLGERRALRACAAAAILLGGLTLLRNYSYRSELSVWSEVSARHPESVRARNNLGLALVRERKFEEAAAQFAESIRRDPSYVRAYNNLGLTLARLGRPEEAAAQFRKAQQIEPGYASSYGNLGLLLERQGKLPEAVEQYRKAIELDPAHAKTHNNLGLVLAAQGGYEEAEKEYAEAIRLDPRFSDAYNNLGDAYAKQGRLREALEQFRRATRIDPANAAARENEVRILQKLAGSSS